MDQTPKEVPELELAAVSGFNGKFSNRDTVTIKCETLVCVVGTIVVL